MQVIGVKGYTGAPEASRELLFFSLAICTLALSELRNADAMMRNRGGYETLNYAPLLAIAVSAALYGLFLSVHTNPKFVAEIFSIRGATSTQIFM